MTSLTEKYLKRNKATVHSNIDSNVRTNNFDKISHLMSMIFHCRFSKDILPEQLKVVKVTPNFKTADSEEEENYRPVSVLLHFGKY